MRYLLIAVVVFSVSGFSFESRALVCNASLPTAPPSGDPCGDDPEILQLDFGQVAAPLNGNGQIVIRRSGAINGGQTDLAEFSGDTSQGRTRIRGTNNSRVTFNFVSNSVIPGLDITNFDARYNSTNFNDDGSPSSVSTDLSARTRGRNISYGATLEVSSTVSPGTYNVPYEIRVLYDNCAPCTTAPINRVAVVEVEPPPSLSEVSGMDYGRVLKPSSATSDIRMDTNGSMTVINGDAILLDGSSGTPGIINIVAMEDATISVSASLISGAPGLSLDSFRGLYYNTELPIDSPANFDVEHSSDNLNIGATLRIDRSNVVRGAHLLDYEVEVDYN